MKTNKKIGRRNVVREMTKKENKLKERKICEIKERNGKKERDWEMKKE